MANNKHPKTDPADLTLGVWTIEQKDKGVGGKWIIHRICPKDINLREYDVAYWCARLSEQRPAYEFRYRAATLTFDDDGRKCVIY